MTTRITDNGKGYKNLAHKAKVSSFHVDHRDWGPEAHEQVASALKSHGLHLHESPAFSGQDSHGYHIANKKLNKDELKKADKKNFPMLTEED